MFVGVWISVEVDTASRPEPLRNCSIVAGAAGLSCSCGGRLDVRDEMGGVWPMNDGGDCAKRCS